LLLNNSFVSYRRPFPPLPKRERERWREVRTKSIEKPPHPQRNREPHKHPHSRETRSTEPYLACICFISHTRPSSSINPLPTTAAPYIHTSCILSRNMMNPNHILHLLPPERAALGQSGLATGRLAEDLRATCFVKVKRKARRKDTRGTKERKICHHERGR